MILDLDTFIFVFIHIIIVNFKKIYILLLVVTHVSGKSKSWYIMSCSAS
jgi:hypothetical protein